MSNHRKDVRRREDRLWKRSLSIGYVILTISIAAGLYALEKRDIERTETAASASCHRVNILRKQVNTTSLVAYRAFYGGGKREEAQIKRDPKNAKAHRATSKALFAVAAKLRYQPYTNCKEAVKHPHDYEPPDPRPFTKADLR